MNNGTTPHLHRSSGSIFLDGVNDYLSSFSFFYGQQFNPANTNEFGLSFWFKPVAIGARQCMMSKFDYAGTKGWYIDMLPDGTIEFIIESSVTAKYGGASATPLTAGEWHHIVVTNNGKQTVFDYNARIYLNGVNDTLLNYSGSTGLLSINHNVDYFLGTRQFGSTTRGIYANGNFCEVAYHALQLPSLSQVREMYDGGSPRDLEQVSLYQQQLFGAHINKWYAFSETHPSTTERFESLGSNWRQSRLGLIHTPNFLTVSSAVAPLLENGMTDTALSFDHPGGGT